MEIISKWKARLKIQPITDTKSQSCMLIYDNCSKISENHENNSGALQIKIKSSKFF